MTSQLSPRGSVAMGLFFIACGLLIVAMASGLIPATKAEDVPAWVPACAGLAFVAAGLLVIVDFGVARLGPDGQLVPDTPLPIQLASLLIALVIVGLFAVIAGWIAFGPGRRAFSTSVSIPFVTFQSQSGELSGRIVFGISTIVLVAVFGASGTVGLRRLWREWQTRAGGPKS